MTRRKKVSRPPGDEPIVYQTPSALLVFWNAEVTFVERGRRLDVPEGLSLPCPAEFKAHRGLRMVARTPAEGFSVQMSTADARMIEVGNRRVTELERVIRAAIDGDVRPLRRFIKLFTGFDTHPDVRPVLERLAAIHPSLAAALRGDPQRGRPVAAGENYAKVVDLRRRQSELSFEQAMEQVFGETSSRAHAKDTRFWEAFRRRVYDEQLRCEAYLIPERIDLEALVRQLDSMSCSTNRTEAAMSKGGTKGSGGSKGGGGSQGTSQGGKSGAGSSSGKGGWPSTTGKPSGTGRNNGPRSK